jgi:hypothetical protein
MLTELEAIIESRDVGDVLCSLGGYLMHWSQAKAHQHYAAKS